MTRPLMRCLNAVPWRSLTRRAAPGIRNVCVALLSFVLAGLLTGCPTHSRMARPEPPALTVPGAVAWKNHAGETFAFQYPADWEIHTPAVQAPELQLVRLHSENGFYGQVTLIRAATSKGVFVAQVLENMRTGEQGLRSEPYAAQLAGGDASGHRFTFQKEGVAWSGWVLSRPSGSGELCVLGRWPTQASDLETQWMVVNQSLQLTAGMAAPAP